MLSQQVLHHVPQTGPSVHRGQHPMPGLRVGLGVPVEVLHRGHRALIPAVYAHTTLGICTNHVDDGMPLLLWRVWGLYGPWLIGLDSGG